MSQPHRTHVNALFCERVLIKIDPQLEGSLKASFRLRAFPLYLGASDGAQCSPAPGPQAALVPGKL